MNMFGIVSGLFAPKSLLAGFKSIFKLRVEGNLYGDGWQNGGCLVVEHGGGEEPLLHYIQQGAPDHVPNEMVLKVKIKN